MESFKTCADLLMYYMREYLNNDLAIINEGVSFRSWVEDDDLFATLAHDLDDTEAKRFADLMDLICKEG